ncbi:hypothetical protein [Sporosarcina sp. FSL K6-1508]|uniref:hypothetical protein n=1 Tax=Sporosarcina sp. FSL K6-1508 TaxID=2921553 RepID=UPI0030FB8EA2
MTIEGYIKRRNNGQSLGDIQNEKGLSEATVWTMELGYQCHLCHVPLDQAISVIKRLVSYK